MGWLSNASWNPWALKKIPKDEALKKIKPIVLAEHPHWEQMEQPMPDDVYEAIYALSRCTVCHDPRYAHHRGEKRHLITYGGTG